MIRAPYMSSSGDSGELVRVTYMVGFLKACSWQLAHDQADGAEQQQVFNKSKLADYKLNQTRSCLTQCISCFAERVLTHAQVHGAMQLQVDW